MKMVNSKPKVVIIYPFFRDDAKRAVLGFCQRYGVIRPHMTTMDQNQVKLEWFRGHKIVVKEDPLNLSQVIFEAKVSFMPLITINLLKTDIFFRLPLLMSQHNLQYHIK